MFEARVTNTHSMKSDLISAPEVAGGIRDNAQAVVAPLTRAAIFLVVKINPGPDHRATIRSFCGDLAAVLRAVEFRDIEAGLSCVVGFGSEAWDRLFGAPRPANLHAFREIRAGTRHAVSTPGDLLFHIRAKRMDLCFEWRPRSWHESVMRCHPSMRCMDSAISTSVICLVLSTAQRIPGTKRPSMRRSLARKTPHFAVAVMSSCRNIFTTLPGGTRCPRRRRNESSGARNCRTSNWMIPPSLPRRTVALTTIVENGKEIKILRDNMPFGKAGSAEFGTYFIGYSRAPSTIEQMLENMFVGRPPGNYDRLLDFSRAVTGNLFFVPSATFLENVSADSGSMAAPSGVSEAGTARPSMPQENDGSLGIGSLKGDIPNE